MKGKNTSDKVGFIEAPPDIIRISSDAFEKLLDAVIEYTVSKCEGEKNVWLTEKETMSIIGISSKTTLLKLRQEGKIKYTQPYKRVIMYDKISVLEFLNKHIKETF